MRDTPVLREQGVGRAVGYRILEKFTMLQRLKAGQNPPIGLQRRMKKKKRGYLTIWTSFIKTVW
jgi:hypothetical protein